MSKGTKYFNLDLYEENDVPNLLDQYNSAINKIDTQLSVSNATSLDAKNAALSANNSINTLTPKIEQNTTNITNIGTKLDATLDKNKSKLGACAFLSIDDNLNNASTNPVQNKVINSSINNINQNINNIVSNHFPIPTDSIKDGAVTTAKLSSDALSALLKGMTIKHFDTDDKRADNSGMILNDKVKLAGYYVPELTLLIINYISMGIGITKSNWLGAPLPSLTLPSYIPHPGLPVHYLGIMNEWHSDNNYVNYTFMHLRTDGTLGLSSALSTDQNTELISPGICFLRAYGVSS